MVKKNVQSKPWEQQKTPQEFEQKLLDVARVARVTKGGRRFSFRAVVVIGDRKGRVGVGVDKGKDVRIAMEKSTRQAKKNLINVPMTKNSTIPHESYGKFASAVVFLKPAAEGRGIIAGGSVRAVCDLAGYNSIIGKMISRTNNKLNNARATIEALRKIKAPRDTEKNTIKEKTSKGVKRKAKSEK